MLDKEITSGEIKVTVTYNDIQLLDKTYDVCELVEKSGDQCPISTGIVYNKVWYVKCNKLFFSFCVKVIKLCL